MASATKFFFPFPSGSNPAFDGHTLIVVRLHCSHMLAASHVLCSQPAVSVGNVGQLAADLVVFNLGLHKVGHIHDTSISPVCCNDAFLKRPYKKNRVHSKGNLSTAVEGLFQPAALFCFPLRFRRVFCGQHLSTVYSSATLKITLVQQRSPCVKVLWQENRWKQWLTGLCHSTAGRTSRRSC